MLDTITFLLEGSNKSKLGHVVWLGCGLANDANRICALKPSKLVLTEAIEELTNKLERRFQGSNIVDIANYCISSDGQPTVFYHTQPYKFSSLLEPTELVNFYPNAVVDAVFEHPTLSANSLLSDYELNPNHFNVLILELNGYEQALIPCIKKQHLHQFDAIIVAQTIHCDVSNKEQLEQDMEQLAFQLTDSEGLYRAYLRNDTQLRVHQLEKRQLEWQEKQKYLESNNEKLSLDKSLLEAKLAQLQESNQDLSEINENAVAHIHQLLNDNEQLEAKESELLSSLASLESRISNLTTENTEFTEAKKVVELENGKLKAESDKAQGERDKAQEERNLAQSRVNELTQQLEQHKQQSEAKESELLSSLASLESRISNLTTENTEFTEAKKVVELENGKLKVESDKAQGERDKAREERNLAQSRVNELTQQIEQYKQQSEAEQSELLSRLSHLESSNSSLETCNADLIKQNTELTQAKKLAELESEKLKVKRDDAKSQVESKVKLLEEVTKRAEEEKAELVSRLSTLESELEVRTKQRDNEHKWHDEYKSWAETLNSQLEQARAELAEKNRSVNLGQKMLAKAQVDLDHLRDSYAKKVEAEKELIELVKELREKLTLASKYYFKLQQEHPELLAAQAQSEEGA